MTRSNLATILVSIALVVLPYLLVQSDVTVPPVAKVVIQVSILAVGVIARYLPTDATPTKVEISTPVPVQTVETPPTDPTNG